MSIPSKLTAWLTINRACNLRCAWCYAQSTQFTAENMELETAQTAVELLRALPVRTVFLIGGEPTVHPDFLKIVRLVRDSDMLPMLITNGMAFHNKAFLQRTLDAGLSGITTSLKAGSAAQYRKHTGRNAFDRVMAGIRNVEKLRHGDAFPHRVAVTMCRELFDDLPNILDVIRDSGVGEFSIDTERPIFLEGKARPVPDITPQQMADLLVQAYPMIRNAGVPFSIRLSLPFCLFPPDFIQELRRNRQLISGCQLIAGNGLIIDPKGQILPCNHFCDHPIGQITPGFFADDYRAFRARGDVLRFYRAMSGCPDKSCKHCDQWISCGGGCRVHWFALGADDLLPEAT